jgi:hypothetical protein
LQLLPQRPAAVQENGPYYPCYPAWVLPIRWYQSTAALDQMQHPLQLMNPLW